MTRNRKIVKPIEEVTPEVIIDTTPIIEAEAPEIEEIEEVEAPETEVETPEATEPEIEETEEEVEAPEAEQPDESTDEPEETIDEEEAIGEKKDYVVLLGAPSFFVIEKDGKKKTILQSNTYKRGDIVTL